VATSTVGNMLDSLTPGGPAAAAQARHAQRRHADRRYLRRGRTSAKADAIMGGFGASAA
jgi:hypothetical protein